MRTRALTLLIGGLALLSAMMTPAEAGTLYKIKKEWTIIFRQDGTLALWRPGWVNYAGYPIKAIDGIWYIYPEWTAVKQPIDLDVQPSPEERFTAHLEPGGKVSYWGIISGLTVQYPAKVINGDWNYYVEGEWAPVFPEP
jgi:hypothetical protein